MRTRLAARRFLLMPWLALVACGTDTEQTTPPDDLDVTEAAATAAPPRCEMYNQTACLLNTSSSSSRRVFQLAYPTTQFCGVRLIPTKFAADLQPLADELEASLFDSYDGATKTVPLQLRPNTLQLGVGTHSLYLVDITLRTKSGRSLSKVIQEKLGGQLVAVPQFCPGRD